MAWSIYHWTHVYGIATGAGSLVLPNTVNPWLSPSTSFVASPLLMMPTTTTVTTITTIGP